MGYPAMKKISLIRFYFIVILESASSNFILPVTPTIIKNLHLSDYMFGLTYAGMSLTCFLFAPFWVKLSDHIGRVNVYAAGCFGYAAAQLMFCFSTTQGSIMAARTISGIFIGGINVCHLTYLIDVCEGDELGRNVVLMSTLVSVFSAFGYLIGGVLGVASIFLTFVVQVVILAFCGLFLSIFLKDGSGFQPKNDGLRSILKETNPFSAFLNVRHWMSRAVGILMLSFFLIYVASTACDQCFNYYIKDQFGFPPSYNGALKALMGFITLIVNMTLCRRIIRKTNVRRSFVLILLCCAVSSFALVVSNMMQAFLCIYVVYFAFNSINVTLQQSIVSNIGKEGNNMDIVSIYNSTQSLGMVIGSFIAGFIYEISSISSFLMGAVLFFVGAVLMLIGGKPGKSAGAVK